MTVNFPKTEPNDLYTRDFLVRVPNAFPQDSQSSKRKQPSNVVPCIVSCFSMAAMIVYQLTPIGVLMWDIKTPILVIITGVVSFALTYIFATLFFGEK
jgi:hypothetical protein